MGRIHQIGVYLDGKDNNHPILKKLLDNFPLPPCHMGALKNIYQFDFLTLWEYEKYDDEWTLSDSLIDYLFVENYRSILTLSDLGHLTCILATEELGFVFKYGHYNHRLFMCYLSIDKKEHGNKVCFTSKEYVRYLVKKFKTKSVSYMSILDVLNQNPNLEDSLVSLIKLTLNQIVSLRKTLDKNVDLIEEEDRDDCFELFESICIKTKSTAMYLSINHRENFLACWRDR